MAGPPAIAMVLGSCQALYLGGLHTRPRQEQRCFVVWRQLGRGCSVTQNLGSLHLPSFLAMRGHHKTMSSCCRKGGFSLVILPL